MNNIKLNNWEDKPPEFLSNVFDGDANDIVNIIKSFKCKRIVEVGFGNNRLIQRIIKLKGITYFGFDKTKSFVDRANESIKSEKTSFYLADIEKIKTINEIKSLSPDIIIFRHVIEHLKDWKKVLNQLNRSKIKLILISIHNPYTVNFSKSSYDISNNGKNIFTLNFFCEDDLDNYLSNYSAKVFEYKNYPHTLRLYKIIN